MMPSPASGRQTVISVPTPLSVNSSTTTLWGGAAVDHVDLVHAALQGAQDGVGLDRHAALDRRALLHPGLAGRRRVSSDDQLAVLVQDAGDVGEEDQLAWP